MVSTNLYVGVDVSTTAAKAIVIEADDATYTVIARGQHAFKPLQTHADHPGRAEQVNNGLPSYEYTHDNYTNSPRRTSSDRLMH